MPSVIARSVSDEAIQPSFRGAGLLRFARNDGKAGFRVEFMRDWQRAKARWGDAAAPGRIVDLPKAA